MQAKHSVTHVRRERSGENALGQPIYTESPPRRRLVFGWQPISNQERNDAARAGRTVTDLLLMMPDGDYGPSDQVTLPNGGVYEVDGEVRDYNAGPFRLRPGFAVELRRVANA